MNNINCDAIFCYLFYSKRFLWLQWVSNPPTTNELKLYGSYKVKSSNLALLCIVVVGQLQTQCGGLKGFDKNNYSKPTEMEHGNFLKTFVIANQPVFQVDQQLPAFHCRVVDVLKSSFSNEVITVYGAALA